MAPGKPRLVLPHVPGWRQPPPPLTFPLFELATWVGPRWMLFYDDGSRGTSLGSVTLAFGELAEDGPRRCTDVTTAAKLRSVDPSLRHDPVSLNDVCEKAQFTLVEREAAYARANERLTVSHDLMDALPPPLWNAPEGYVPERFGPTDELTVDGRQVPAFATTGPRGWAVCADLGETFVSVTGDGVRCGHVALAEVADLGPYLAATTNNSES